MSGKRRRRRNRRRNQQRRVTARLAKAAPCQHQIVLDRDGKPTGIGTGPCDPGEDGRCKRFVDKYAVIMRGLCGQDDAPNSVGWMSSEQAAERDRVQGWMERQEANSGSVLEYYEPIDVNGKTFLGLLEFKEWQRRNCYDLLCAGLVEPHIAVRTHQTPDEVDAIAKEFLFK